MVAALLQCNAAKRCLKKFNFIAPQANCSLESGWLSAVTSATCKYLYLDSTSKALGGEGGGDPSIERGGAFERQSIAISSAALWVLGGGIEMLRTGGRVRVRGQSFGVVPSPVSEPCGVVWCSM